jgi:hypothetical protein
MAAEICIATESGIVAEVRAREKERERERERETEIHIRIGCKVAESGTAAEICTATESGIAAEVRAREKDRDTHSYENIVERARDETPKRGNCAEIMPNLYRVTPEVLLMGLLVSMLQVTY